LVPSAELVGVNYDPHVDYVIGPDVEVHDPNDSFANAEHERSLTVGGLFRYSQVRLYIERAEQELYDRLNAVKGLQRCLDIASAVDECCHVGPEQGP